MTAVAAPIAPSTGFSGAELQERFTHFAAATESASTIGEVNTLYGTIAADPEGIQWLQDLLSNQNLQDTTSTVDELSVGAGFLTSAPTSIGFGCILNTCRMIIGAGPLIMRKGKAQHKGKYAPGVGASRGFIKYENLAAIRGANKVRVVGNQVSVTVEFKTDDKVVGTYTGNGVKWALNFEVPLTGWVQQADTTN